MEPAIVIEDLWKRYTLLHGSAPMKIKDAVLEKVLRRHTPREQFWALRGVTLTVERGQALGIVGPNGSGKSTLLSVVSKVLVPTRGKATVNGRITALLGAAASFHPDLTGLENVAMIASLMGMPRRELVGLLPEIVAFAGAEDYVDTVVRTYSTGMQARLAFATAIHMGPDVLLLDEVLAVGDERFQKQAYARIMAMQDAGCTIVFVSHVMEQVRQICDRVIWLEQGQVMGYGPTEDTIEQYLFAQRAPRPAKAAPPDSPL